MQLLYDRTTDNCSLHIDAENMADQLSWLSRQQRTQWYLFTKNRAKKASIPTLAVSAFATDQGARMGGEISCDLFDGAKHWLSFERTDVFDHDVVTIEAGDGSRVQISNASNAAQCEQWLPKYEASPKHRLGEYVRASGDNVAPMDLDEATAQRSLLQSVAEGKNRYAMEGQRFYRFIPTRAESFPPIFHGFLVDEREVPPAVLKLLKE
ncbi:hypothetical protein [Paraburkholderia sediminicola]|uniref:hypothetical protein n=1 Tax=Paraburkholderia sediminicola TaxID=458836 RepID=UPI0038BA41DF